jgi:uncharacterized membrane protein YfcA
MLDTSQMTLLVASAFFGGLVDAVAGGGGLLTIPALLSVGIPPAMAIGTNKLQAIIGSATASYQFIKKGNIDTKKLFPLMVTAFIGAVLGGFTISYLDNQLLKLIMPYLLVLIALYFLFSSKLTSNVETKQRISMSVFCLSLCPLIGWYDGFLGPGTGSFLIASFVGLLGFGLMEATMGSKLVNFATNLAALIILAFSGKVLWSVGFLMMIGQFLGALIGVKLIFLKGNKLIRPMIVIVCIVMAIKLAFF